MLILTYDYPLLCPNVPDLRTTKCVDLLIGCDFDPFLGCPFLLNPI